MKLENLSNRKNIILVLFFLGICFFTSCIEKRTRNPQEAYKYWAGRNAPADLQLLKGQYWQSAYWSKEYKMYLKLKPTKVWWDEFLKQNALVLKEDDWAKSKDSPDWFRPSNNSLRYGKNGEFDHGSTYIQDTLSNICYIYEIQL